MITLFCFSPVAQLTRPLDGGQEDIEPADTEKSLKMKLCLYLESLFAAMEVGIPI